MPIEIDAYRNVYEAWQNAEASMRFADDDQWKDTLGSKEEIQEALQISAQSLHFASSSFSKEEIREAQKNNLLQTHEVQKIVSSQRQGEMRSVREIHNLPILPSMDKNDSFFLCALRGFEGGFFENFPHGFQRLTLGKMASEFRLFPFFAV